MVGMSTVSWHLRLCLSGFCVRVLVDRAIADAGCAFPSQVRQVSNSKGQAQICAFHTILGFSNTPDYRLMGMNSVSEITHNIQVQLDSSPSTAGTPFPTCNPHRSSQQTSVNVYSRQLTETLAHHGIPAWTRYHTESLVSISPSLIYLFRGYQYPST